MLKKSDSGGPEDTPVVPPANGITINNSPTPGSASSPAATTAASSVSAEGAQWGAPPGATSTTGSRYFGLDNYTSVWGADAPAGWAGLPKVFYAVKDANGKTTQVASAAQYMTGMDKSEWYDMDETDRIATKKMLYLAGYYGKNDNVFLGNLVTDEDVKAMANAMADANLSGRTWSDITQARFEKGLLAGRPYGEDPVDLNGDGKPDADVTAALRSFAGRNGLDLTDNYIGAFAQQVIGQKMTLEDAMQNIRETFVANAYPAWKDQILKGADIADIAAPYIQSIANGLEVPAEAITMNDPLVKQALQATSPDGKPTYKALWQVDKDLRNDPRWQKTSAAHKEYGDMALSILQSFGMVG